MLEQINNIKIIAGNSNLELSKDIAESLNTSLVKSKVVNFSDGEINVDISETIRGEDVFVVQSICETSELTVNDSLMELLIIIDALKELQQVELQLLFLIMDMLVRIEKQNLEIQ